MAIIARPGASTLVPEDYARGILKNVTEMSAAMSLLERRRMRAKEQRMSILTTKPTAGFILASTGIGGADSDTGVKPLTVAAWADLKMYAEPVAALVVIPEDVIEDAGEDLWGEIKPELEEAIAAAIDAAVFFGTGAPSTWPVSINAHAVAAGNTVALGAGVDLAADLNTAMGLVEADGFYPDGWFYSQRYKATLRGLRDNNKQFLWSPRGPANTGLQNAGADDEISRRRRDVSQAGEIWGLEAHTSAMGLAGFDPTPTTGVMFITGDFTKAILGVRADIRFKMLDQAAVDDGGTVLYLAQRDLIGLRVVTRVAYVLTNTASRMNTNAATRSPFASVRQA